MGFRYAFQDLFGRSDRRLVELLVAHVDAVTEGADAVSRAVRGELGGAELERHVRDVEHIGDDRRKELVEHMIRSLTLPLDREDVYRLSRSIDDILDCLRDFSEEWSLYEATSDPFFLPLIEEITAALAELRIAAGLITKEPNEVAIASQATKKRATKVRRAYQRALRDLFDRDGPVTGLTLKHRELLRRLDVVALKLSDAADVLADAAVKRNL